MNIFQKLDHLLHCNIKVETVDDQHKLQLFSKTKKDIDIDTIPIEQHREEQRELQEQDYVVIQIIQK